MTRLSAPLALQAAKQAISKAPELDLEQGMSFSNLRYCDVMFHARMFRAGLRAGFLRSSSEIERPSRGPRSIQGEADTRVQG